MEPNRDKLALSRTMTDLEGGLITSDVCHNYGIIGGCDEGCPALLDGDCRNFADAIEYCELTDDARAELLTLYA